MTVNELLAAYRNDGSCRLTISGELEPAGQTLVGIEQVNGALVFSGSVKDWKDDLVPNRSEIGKKTVTSFMTTIAEKDHAQFGFLWIFVNA